MTTPRDALATALAEVDRQADRLLALALAGSDELAPDARQAAADVAVGAYEVADRRADMLLDAVIAAGGCPGLLDALGEAQGRAARRQASIYQLKLSEGLARPAARAQAIADHAWNRALEREQRVIVAVALPFWRRRVEGVAQ